MLSTLSNSAFGMKYLKTVDAAPVPVVYSEFAYTLNGQIPSQHSLLDSPDPYAITATGGYCTISIDGLSSSSFTNVTKTVYIKSKFGTATNDTGTLFMFVHGGSALDTGASLSMYKDSANGSQIKYVVGSNGTEHRNETITGQSGSEYFHIFMVIRSNNTLDTYIYDESVTQKYSSTTTIVSSTFGNDFARWQYNGRLAYPATNARKITVGGGGTWSGELTVAEMETEVTANPN